MRPTLNVIFAFGKYFIQFFTVSLTSLLETNKDIDLKIYLIYDFDEALLQEVVNFVKVRYHIELILLYQDSKVFENYRVAEHVSLNTYLRLLLANIVPEEVETGLFLDSDTIVTGSLMELANLKFDDDCSIFAVREIPEQSDANSKRISKLGFKTDKYFNAGILLIDLENWRKNNISDQLLNLATKYMNDLVFWDQDVLNMFFANHWGELDSKFNALNLIWKRRNPPLIIHFAGKSKPWNYLNRHPYKEYYFKNLALTPFKEARYTDYSLVKAPYKYYRDFRHFLNYYRQKLLGNNISEAYHD